MNTNWTSLYNFTNNATTLLQHLTQLYTIIQNMQKYANCTKPFLKYRKITTLQAHKLYQHFSTLYTIYTTSQDFQSFRNHIKLIETLHNLTQLYQNTSSTKLYTNMTLKIEHKLHTTLQHFYTTLHCFFKTTYNTLQHFSIL